MDPPNINYIDYKSLLVINPAGQMRQLFVPFKVQVMQPAEYFKVGTWVEVEEIMPHDQYKLLYRIGTNWWPYYIFRLTVLF
jgi:hypothetical protein